MVIILPTDKPDQLIDCAVYFFENTYKTLILKVENTEDDKQGNQKRIIGRKICNTANVIENGFNLNAPKLIEMEKDEAFKIGEIEKTKTEIKEKSSLAKRPTICTLCKCFN